MSWFSKKEEKSNEGPKPFTVKTTILKGKSTYGTYDEYTVTVEGSGFSGTAKSMKMSLAFEEAYTKLMDKVSEAIFQE